MIKRPSNPYEDTVLAVALILLLFGVLQLLFW